MHAANMPTFDFYHVECRFDIRTKAKALLVVVAVRKGRLVTKGGVVSTLALARECNVVYFTSLHSQQKNFAKKNPKNITAPRIQKIL